MSLVSVVIPCFNDERFVGEAIESALAQTYADIEVLVVDDGSTDDSAGVAGRFGSPVRVVRKPNDGVSSARNFGIERARGEYIVFLDADDRLDPHFVTKTLRALHEDPGVGFAYTQFRFVGREQKVSEWHAFDRAQLTVGNYISPTALIRVAALGSVRFDERLRTGYEDWDFYLSLAEQGTRGVLVDEPLLLYRKHETRDRLTDRMIDPPNKRKAKLFIMRKHLREFGVPAYLHFYAHHVKETAKDAVNRR